jgi:uncharacterized protein YigE (DUF2233 family)
MRFLFMAVLAFLGFSRAGAEWAVQDRQELGGLPGGAAAWQCTVSGTAGTIRLTGVSFSAAKAAIRVVDNPPEGRLSFPGLLVQKGAFAGVNGGYFHPDYRPLGLAVSGGREIHGFEKAKLLSGVLAVRGNRIELVRSGAFKPGKDVDEALQAGPWLVEKGAPVTGLNAQRRARRSVVATDGKGHWAIVTTGPLTLAETAAVLALPEIPGNWTVRDALNLDGGSSTALWAATEPKALEIFSFGAVRNYLAIVPRQK